jgi:hypothetical protein
MLVLIPCSGAILFIKCRRRYCTATHRRNWSLCASRDDAETGSNSSGGSNDGDHDEQQQMQVFYIYDMSSDRETPVIVPVSDSSGVDQGALPAYHVIYPPLHHHSLPPPPYDVALHMHKPFEPEESF